jgi:hypothetical protein
MMSDLETNHLKLPYIAAAQAQKHVTHNEALRLLDSAVQLAVLDSTLTEPPASPAEGDRYVVAAAATDAWEGHDGEVATWVDGAWMFAEPGEGWLAFDLAAEVLLVQLGGTWTEFSSGGGMPESVEELGINATPDATNRLAVRSEAVLFSGIDVGDGGSGDIRFVINKEADGDTASLLFQSGFDGRAEVGLVGDTDFVFKVSPDGDTWFEAIRIDKDTGLSAILYDNTASGLDATTIQEAIDEVADGMGGGGAVASVFGRTGAVVAAAGDYAASEVDNDSGVSGATVKDALDALAAGGTEINTQTSDYEAVLGDAGKTIEMNAGSANVFTVPANGDVAFPVGTVVNLVQLGAGATTIAPGSGVTIRNRNGLVLAGQYAVATLYKRGTDEWVAAGDLKT